MASKVLLEVFKASPEPFERFAAAATSTSEAEAQADSALADLADLTGLGIDIDENPPVPMFLADTGDQGLQALGMAMRRTGRSRAARSAGSLVVQAEVTRGRLAELQARDDLKVWPNSELVLYGGTVFDRASSRGGLDCRPFREPAAIAELRELLGVGNAWADGYRGQNVVVGVLDEGIDGVTYPVTGGFAQPIAGRQPGAAPTSSHGSMCAAGILVAAPAARLYDYPFLGVPRSGGALVMFQAVLDQRRRDGMPHLTNNSYGFIGVPDPATNPDHEVNNPNHPLHRKVREVVAAGVACFFAAGNCGQHCPSANCHVSGIGPGRSIHASNSLAEVITVAAANVFHERVGYSSQGPGMFAEEKPDIAAYSHYLANFGPGRPGGESQPFDNGTSAASPLAAGIGAMLLSAFPDLAPEALKSVLTGTATRVGTDTGWSADYGHGIVNAAAAYTRLVRAASLTS